MIYHYPYSADELSGMSPPQRPQAWRRRWTVVSLLCGVTAAVLAFSSVGAIAVVIGGIGIAAGTLAVLRAGRVFAITGAVASSLAVAMSVLMALPVARDTAAAPPTPAVHTDVDQVLADEVDVRFGGFTPNLVFPEVSVTVTNKRAVVRQCDIEVGAFAAPGEQISSGRVKQKSSGYGGMVLDAHATVAASAEFLLGGDDTAKDQLNSAGFRVITVACGPFDYAGI